MIVDRTCKDTTSESEKIDKLKANRRFRRKVKEEVNGSKEVLTELREVSNVWSGPLIRMGRSILTMVQIRTCANR
jgi:hypothetical protein